MNTKRITLYLYKDEYNFMQEKSKKERLPMNKIFQFWIRDQMKEILPVKIKIDNIVKGVPKIDQKFIDKSLYKPETLNFVPFEMPQSFGSHKK